MKTEPTTPKLGLAFIAIALVMFAGIRSVCAQSVLTNVVIPASMNTIAVNPALNKMYISGGYSPASITVMDGTTFSEATIGSGTGGDVDLTKNTYWSAGLYSGNVTVWNSANAAITSVTLSGCPGQVCVDAPHRVVWAAAQCGGGGAPLYGDPIYAVNADTYAKIAGPIGSGGTQGSVAVNPATGRLYINPNGVSRRVNPSTFAVTANAFGNVMGANAWSNLLYAQTASTTLQIINGAPDPEVVLTTVTLPFTFSYGYQLGVNPVLNRLYIGSTSSGIVMILNATTGQSITNVSLGSGITGVGSIAVDVSRNRVYAYGYGGSSPYLSVIQDGPGPSLGIAPFGSQSVLFWPASAGNYVLQSVTNLSSTNWVTVSNGTPIIGVTLTNALPAAYFRLVTP